MPELFAVLATISHIVGYVFCGCLIVSICIPIMVAFAIFVFYVVMIMRALGSWMCGDDENEEAA